MAMKRIALLVPWLLVGACGELDAPMDPGSYDEALQSPNGMSINGITLNGMSINGMSINGMSINGMSINGMSINGMSINGMSINGTSFTGITSDGQTVSGAGVVGATLTGTLSDGSTIDLRIDSATTLASPNTDVWAYGVSYQTDSGWAPLCGSNGSGPILAIPILGTFNYQSGVVGGGSYTPSSTLFTFGCRGAGIAKCVELGYKPWLPTPNGDDNPLIDGLVGCTRMLRADYCGNGTSFTVNGTVINVYDRWDIQLDTEAWPVEAEWTTGGAACIQSVTQTRAYKLLGVTPSCFPALIKGSCGNRSHFNSGSPILLIDEYQSQ
jgi:ADYC domain-containing protein